MPSFLSRRRDSKSFAGVEPAGGVAENAEAEMQTNTLHDSRSSDRSLCRRAAWNGPRVAQSIMRSCRASVAHAPWWCDDSASAEERQRGMEKDATRMQADLESDIAGSRPPAH
jgi:hypothetical protein